MKHNAFLTSAFTLTFMLAACFFANTARGEDITYPGNGTLADPAGQVLGLTGNPNSIFPNSDVANNVTMTANVTANDVSDVYGAITGSVSATDNHVYITGGRVGRGSNVGGSVYGAWSGVGYSSNGNTVTVAGTGRVDRAVYGAWVNSGAAGAENNSVTINADATVHTLYGAYANSTGDLSDNEVVINGGTVTGAGSFVAGAYTGPGNNGATVSDNSVVINGGTISATVANPISIYGGKGTTNANIEYNSVSINGGQISNVRIYGAQSINGKGIVQGNEVDITGGTIGADIYGGHSTVDMGTPATDIVEDNYVSVSGDATTIVGNIYGGYAKSKLARYNVITIDSGSITGAVYGGYSEAGTDSNAVMINGGGITGNVYGGRSVAGNATYNSVVIDGGTVTETIYSGFTSGNASVSASNNEVILTGVVTVGDIYAGYHNSALGSQHNNAVTIKQPASGSVIGKIYGSNTDSTDNLFEIYATDVQSDGLYNFEALDFYLPDTLANNGTMISATNGADITNAKISVAIDGAGPSVQPGNRYILIESNNLIGDVDPSSSTGTIKGYPYTLEKEGNNLVLKIGLRLSAALSIPTTGGGLLAVLALLLAGLGVTALRRHRAQGIA